MKTPNYILIAVIQLIGSVFTFAATSDKIPGVSVQDAAFFTGKPYDADLESYIFNYRNYNAEIGRWTTSDPSGFPDGANPNLYTNNSVTNAFDDTGLTITLYNKPVAGGGGGHNHSYIYYNVTDCRGKKWNSTISGQPQNSTPGAWGDLLSQPGSDNASTRNNAQNLDYTALGYVEEYCLLKDLLGATLSYGNDLPYFAAPSAGSSSYNSNGYIAGILNALGITSVGYTAATAVGWDNPIPLTYTAKYVGVDCCE